jgi:hypothetical protein
MKDELWGTMTCPDCGSTVNVIKHTTIMGPIHTMGPDGEDMDDYEQEYDYEVKCDCGYNEHFPDILVDEPKPYVVITNTGVALRELHLVYAVSHGHAKKLTESNYPTESVRLDQLLEFLKDRGAIHDVGQETKGSN